MTDHALSPHRPQPPLHPRSLTDMVELVPYLMGFHPRGSLVLIALHGARRRVGVTMRVDLPEARQCAGLADSLAAHARRDGAAEALALVYGDADPTGSGPAGLPEAELVQAVATGLADAGVALLDALYVGTRRWWSYACDRPECCPVEGREVPSANGRTSPAVAAATYAGLVALPSRQALASTLTPHHPVSAEHLRRAEAAVPLPLASDPPVAERSTPGGADTGSDRQRWRQAVLDEIAEAVDRGLAADPSGLPEEKAARFLVALRDPEVRDACCRWVERDRGEAALTLWRHLATRAVPPYDVTALAMVAWSAWHTGAGPLARIAVDRALDRDPGCRLAVLLDEALDRGVNPMTVRGLPRGRRRRSGARPVRRRDGRGP